MSEERDLPDLWDCEATQKWLEFEMNAEIWRLLGNQEPLTPDTQIQ